MTQSRASFPAASARNDWGSVKSVTGRSQELAQSSNLRIESALVSSSLVLVDQTLSSHMIKYRNGILVRSFCCAFVAGGDSRKNTLYHCAHHGALAGITLARFFGLTHAFACLGCIGHGLSSSLSVFGSASHYHTIVAVRQRAYP